MYEKVFICHNYPDSEVGMLRYKLDIPSMSVSCHLRKNHLKGNHGIRTHTRQEESVRRPTRLNQSAIQPLY